MYEESIKQETSKSHPTAGCVELKPIQPTSNREIGPYSHAPKRMSGVSKASRAMKDKEIIAQVWSEMDKPRLTKSVREALEAEDELEGYSIIA